jgi:hypothetical protein
VLTPRVDVGRRHRGVPLRGSKAFKGHTRAESSENRVNMIYTEVWDGVELRS